MTGKREPITYKGRSIGIIVFTSLQLLIGAIHALSGILLIASGESVWQATEAYNVYTTVFGLLVMVFAVFVWQGKKEGWIGTIAVSVFITIADLCRVLNLPSIPGIPSFAPPVEIAYSIIVIIYLSLPHVRRKFFP
jgi:hypothetical protein